MTERPRMVVCGIVLDSPDARELDEFQPQEGVRVYRDPAGHPFCLFLAE